MAYTYCVRKNIVQDEEKKAYTVYGIEAVGSGGEILSSFSDVFFDRQRAERFSKVRGRAFGLRVRCCRRFDTAVAFLLGKIKRHFRGSVFSVEIQ